jgi:hypothetical protein
MSRFRFVSIVIFHLSLAGIVLAGSANATLECRSQDGVTLTGDIPGDFMEFNLSLSMGKSTLKVSDKKEKIFVTEDFLHNVFGLVVDRQDNSPLQLYAIPSTMKSKGGDSLFDAVLKQAPHPQDPDSFQKILRDVDMNCRYHYSI